MAYDVAISRWFPTGKLDFFFPDLLPQTRAQLYTDAEAMYSITESRTADQMTDLLRALALDPVTEANATAKYASQGSSYHAGMPLKRVHMHLSLMVSPMVCLRLAGSRRTP